MSRVAYRNFRGHPLSPADYLQLISPAAVILGALGVVTRWLWKRIEKRMDEGRDAASKRQDSLLKELIEIKSQTTRTNGTVAQHETRLSHVEGAVDTLMRLNRGP